MLGRYIIIIVYVYLHGLIPLKMLIINDFMKIERNVMYIIYVVYGRFEATPSVRSGLVVVDEKVFVYFTGLIYIHNNSIYKYKYILMHS